MLRRFKPLFSNLPIKGTINQYYPITMFTWLISLYILIMPYFTYELYTVLVVIFCSLILLKFIFIFFNFSAYQFNKTGVLITNNINYVELKSTYFFSLFLVSKYRPGYVISIKYYTQVLSFFISSVLNYLSYFFFISLYYANFLNF